MGGLVFFFGNHAEGICGADADAGGLHSVLEAEIAAVAFLHFSLGVERGGSEWAGHGAAMASDAVGGVKYGKIGFRVLFQTAYRAGGDAGSR